MDFNKSSEIIPCIVHLLTVLLCSVHGCRQLLRFTLPESVSTASGGLQKFMDTSRPTYSNMVELVLKILFFEI